MIKDVNEPTLVINNKAIPIVPNSITLVENTNTARLGSEELLPPLTLARLLIYLHIKFRGQVVNIKIKLL